MFCSRCGCQNNESDKFCAQCGADLGNNNQQLQQQNHFFQPQQEINYNQQIDHSFVQQNVSDSTQISNNINENTQINNNGTYKLTLTRPKDFVGSLIKFKIYIDNNVVGTIKNGETVVLNVNAGNHVISFNKTMKQDITISGDTSASVVFMGGNQFGLANIGDHTGSNVQSEELASQNVDRMVKSAMGPLVFSIGCIVLTFILLFTAKLVVSPWVYGISMGYAVVSLLSLNNHKEALKDKFGMLILLNIISIGISIIGAIISGFLTIG